MKVFSQLARLSVNSDPPAPMPALLNSRWILSVACSAATSSRKRDTCSSSETSTTWQVILAPGLSPSASQIARVSSMLWRETSHIATLAPSAASCRTSSRPIPEPPPVTTAILPAKLFMTLAFRFSRFPSLR